MKAKEKAFDGCLHGFIFGLLLSIAFNFFWNYLYPKLQVKYGLEWNRFFSSFGFFVLTVMIYAYYQYRKERNIKKTE